MVIALPIYIARPVSFLLYTYYKDAKTETKSNTGLVNDASKLNATQVEAVVEIHGNIDTAVQQIVSLVKQASLQNKKISIAGAQHSMGGHTIYNDAIVLDMKGLHYAKYDSTKNIVTVGAGTLWSEIIPYLDRFGKAISVMQSNNSFSVGGSISVNCHGWQPNSPPIASTVESFKLIKADGEIVKCSRSESKELFSLVLGGYGLFGVITEVELRVVDNKMYAAKQYVIKSREYVQAFNQYVTNNPAIGLAYGRININPDNFMEEAILSTYCIDTTAELKVVKQNSLQGLRRTVFRGSANSDYGKNLRWKIEKFATRLVNGKTFSRNQLSNEGVEVFQNNDSAFTDILHEYFIPVNAVSQFIDSVQKIIPGYKVDLLNITVRNVKKDNDTFLSYATEDVFGFVMLFNQSRDSVAEVEMQSLTQRLIAVAIGLEGKYYLPYRLHATREQMHQAYSSANNFFVLKRRHDPKEIFVNKFYDLYK